MNALLLVLLIVGGLVVAGIIASYFVRAVGSANSPAAVTASRAQVLGTRELTTGGATQHWISFRFPDGHQRELLATPSQADVIFRGQEGVVHFAGDRLTGWVPELGGEIRDTHRADQ